MLTPGHRQGVSSKAGAAGNAMLSTSTEGLHCGSAECDGQGQMAASSKPSPTKRIIVAGRNYIAALMRPRLQCHGAYRRLDRNISAIPPEMMHTFSRWSWRSRRRFSLSARTAPSQQKTCRRICASVWETKDCTQCVMDGIAHKVNFEWWEKRDQGAGMHVRGDMRNCT